MVDGVTHRVSAVCPHLGGVLGWNDAERSWDCPLHGSRFTAEGTLLEGPATRDLTRGLMTFPRKFVHLLFTCIVNSVLYHPSRRLPILLAALLGLSLTACGSDYPFGPEQEAAALRANSDLRGTITGSGSSAQGPAMDGWISGFGTLHSQVQLQYSPDGSGAGRGALLADAVQFAGSDAYLNDEELEESREVCGPDGAFNIPAYVAPISIAFNLPGITELDLDAQRSPASSWARSPPGTIRQSPTRTPTSICRTCGSHRSAGPTIQEPPKTSQTTCTRWSPTSGKRSGRHLGPASWRTKTPKATQGLSARCPAPRAP